MIIITLKVKMKFPPVNIIINFLPRKDNGVINKKLFCLNHSKNPEKDELNS